MKQILLSLVLFAVVLFPACGQPQDFSEIDVQEPSRYATPSFEEKDFLFEDTTFYYDGQGYDVASRVESINSILSAIQVGEKIVVECHVGPKNGVYCILTR